MLCCYCYPLASMPRCPLLGNEHSRLPCPCQSPALGCIRSSLRDNAICYLLPTVNFICRTCATCEDTSSWPSLVSFRSLCSMQSALCLFHHGVSVCLQGNQLVHVAVVCYSTRRPLTSRHQRHPCHSNVFFTTREEIITRLPCNMEGFYNRLTTHTCACLCTYLLSTCVLF
jgi:hypothetical protein